ncbi:glycosyltransferase family 2 protein [Anditalea andensis]|uniref:Galactosyltransferase C-terminal domain-containing protein n=1 Tax=Anditalea andensis TaxID=1048983 RepID=A0A074L2C6_9BACT|nr:galactosyltransferase-related protein [Anditalea andensis]KEO75334.1 hypothetical protein EL17_01995 [Anditalea andensis]
MTFSLIITVSGRIDHLRNQLIGIKSSILYPTEIIVVGINEPGLDLSEFSEMAITVVHMEHNSTRLPIAKARNQGAAEASCDKLFFLDVDCIPDQSYFEEMITYFKDDRVLMGTPYYLPKIHGGYNNLLEIAIPHPHRPQYKEAVQENDFNLFWSLCFAMSRESFMNVGGFDEKFLGYGGEDTDFGWKLKDAGMKLWLINAKVYHQQHPVYVPPLGHLEAIVSNATYFYAKRGSWIMENWLVAFKQMGLINWEPDGNIIEIIRYPNSEEKAKAFREDALFM